MKKYILFFFINMCICFTANAQVMHSPHHLGISFGAEAFETFEPRSSSLFFNDFNGSVFGQELLEGDTRWRGIGTLRYRKLQNSGNYFGFLASYGHSRWTEEEEKFITDITGTLTLSAFTEENKEGTLGIAYVYSFLVTKESPNLQFFVGGEGSAYNNFADVIPLDTNDFGASSRNIFGLRIAAVPELIYLFPNSRVTASFRAKLPLIHFERNAQQTRTPSFSSFFRGFSVHNSFDFFADNRVRFELGIGYFLEAK